MFQIAGQTRLSDACYSLCYSPHVVNQLAVVSCENFGIRGCSNLHVITGYEHASFLWSDALFDITFVEDDPSLIVSAGADGAVLVWSVNSNRTTPISCLREHQREVWCVHWSESRSNDALLSTSADGTIKLWNFHR
jgi:WD40 repeat protein